MLKLLQAKLEDEMSLDMTLSDLLKFDSLLIARD